jgi:hypothetical protein
MATKRRSFNMDGLSELLAYLFFPVQRTDPFASNVKNGKSKGKKN